MKQKIIALVILAAMSVACGTVGNDLMGAYNLTQCEYNYKSISNLSISGMNLSSSNALSVTNIAKITSILSGNATSIPLNFTVNMDVKNPNQTTAALSGLRYNLKIDGIEFTNGTMNQGLNIASGGTQVLPLNIGLDVATLMKSDSKNSVLNIVKNFIGIGSEKSKVALDLYPTIKIGNNSITSPVAIPVSFSFGGK